MRSDTAHYPPSEHVPKKQKAASLADFDQAISWKEPSSLNDAEFLEVDDDSANESLIVSSSFDRLVPATSLVRNDDLLPSDHQIKATGTSDLEDVQMHPSLTHYLAERFEAIKHLFAFAWQSVNGTPRLIQPISVHIQSSASSTSPGNMPQIRIWL